MVAIGLPIICVLPFCQEPDIENGEKAVAVPDAAK